MMQEKTHRHETAAAATEAPAPDASADALVAGAGLAGATLALALAHIGMTVSLADDAPVGGASTSASAGGAAGDPRTTALTVPSRRMLARLGAAPDPRHLQPIHTMTITGDPGGGPAGLLQFTDADPPEKNRPLAWMVENRHLTAALNRAVAGSSRIRRHPSRVARLLPVAPGDARVRAVLAEGGCVSAAVCVAADGAGSPLRAQAGIGVTARDYGQDALTATVAHHADHNGAAFQDMLPGGPFAILPLTGRRSAVVWSMPRRHAAALAADRDVFAEELARRFAGRLGGIRRSGPPGRHGLSLRLARRPVSARLVLAGDAAHVIHPLAGLGFNLAARDAAALSDVCHDAQLRGEDPGCGLVLERYQRCRRFDVTALALAIDGVNGVFSSAAPLRWTGTAALDMIGAMGPLRRWLAAAAAGSLGSPPTLLRAD